MGKIYEINSGVVITLETGEELAGATKMEIRYKNPRGKRGAWPAASVSSTKVTYTTQAGDLGVPGVWELQAYVETPSWSGLGETVEMEISNEYQ